jgi:hypothetical protein
MATRHLGELGTVRAPVDMDFPYFGETIRVHPDASDLAAAELMLKAQDIDLGDADINDPESWSPETTKVMVEAENIAITMILQTIHPDDFDRFMKTARANRQNTIDLMSVTRSLCAEVARFPTGLSSVSSAGRHKTKQKSKGGSSSRPAGRDARNARALKLLDGRPDLKMAVWQAEQARRAG